MLRQLGEHLASLRNGTRYRTLSATAQSRVDALIPRLLEAAGADNVARGRIPGEHGTLNPEFLIATQPRLYIGTGIGTDVNELEAALRSAMTEVLAGKGKPTVLTPPAHGPARAGDLRSNLVDAALAGSVLSWRPTVTLAEGLSKTAAWFAASQETTKTTA